MGDRNLNDFHPIFDDQIMIMTPRGLITVFDPANRITYQKKLYEDTKEFEQRTMKFYSFKITDDG